MLPDGAEEDGFPFNRFPRLFNGDFQFEFDSPVTFFVSENGSGKSTLLEAIAHRKLNPPGANPYTLMNQFGTIEQALVIKETVIIPPPV